MDHIGIDVHKRESQIYILAEEGEIIEQRIRTEPERFAAVLGSRPRAQMLIEASTDSEWVARCLEALGHEVIVADPNFAPMYATRSRKVKTDRRDARALAEACLLGAYRPAHRLSDPQRHVRGRLGVRDALVHTRTRYISVIRALLRQHGYRVPSGSADRFIDRVQRLSLPGRVRSVIAPLLAVMGPLNQQLAYSDATIEHLAVQDPRVPRLRSVPGVGPVTAAAFLAAVDDAQRFHHAHQLEAYLGPRAPRVQLGRDAAPRPDHQGRALTPPLAAHSSRPLDPALPAPRGRGALGLGPAHRHAPGYTRRRRRAGPSSRRHPLCAAARWDGVCAPPPGGPA
jgi:transposase